MLAVGPEPQTLNPKMRGIGAVLDFALSGQPGVCACCCGAAGCKAANVTRTYHHLGGFQNYGYHFGSPYNKDYNIFGVYIGVPYLGKLPFRAWGLGLRGLGFKVSGLGIRGG